MISLVLTSFLVVLNWSCAQDDEVTHMPDVEELTLAPHIVNAMQKAKVLPSEECKNHMEVYLLATMGLLDGAVRLSLSGVKGVPLKDITPCRQCRIVNYDFKLIVVEKLIVYRYLEESYILDAYLRLPKIHLECDNCVLTDNGGEQHSGDFDVIWTDAFINILAEDVFENFGFDEHENPVRQEDRLNFLKFNCTNINRDTVHVTCKGDDETFKEVCKSSEESGELHHVMHAASERLINSKDIDVPATTFQTAFRCTKEDL